MPTTSLSVLVIDENHVRAAVIETGLRDAGHRNVAVLHDIVGLARQIEMIAPDAIVIGLEDPGRDLLEHVFQLSRSARRPIAMFVDRADQDSIEAAVAAGVSAYVVDGLKRERVKPILDTAVSRFNAFAQLERELSEVRGELSDRKTVDRAKKILMQVNGLTEPQAYALLRRTAMNQNCKIADVAQHLITAASLLDVDAGKSL